MGDVFRKVRSGQPLRIPAAAYNAFVDAAVDLRRRERNSNAGSALEPAQRGVYGGVVGYLDFAGDADLAIAIRTATIVGGLARVQAGAGLVADSDPAAEHLESQNKAAAPLRAVAVANAMKRVP